MIRSNVHPMYEKWEMKNEVGKVLGQKVESPKAYCPEILVAVPRSLNREIYGIYQPEELFCGYDSWHGYEASFIQDNGVPVAGLLKIVYSSTSYFIVESKSLKLYLASFNMTPLGATQEECIQNYIHRVETDLSKLLATKVKACFYRGCPSSLPFDFNEYQPLEELIFPEDTRFSIYQEHPTFLSEHINTQAGEMKVCSHLLKSNCKITHQPDWGSIYIRLKGKSMPAKVSLLKYIVSLRNENHFHEEICEMIYKRLADIFKPEILMVCCLYTRRGGIDICPSRANHPDYLPQHLICADQLTQRSFRQ